MLFFIAIYMAERAYSEPSYNLRLAGVLIDAGVNFPFDPCPDNNFPRRWLIRSETFSPSKLCVHGSQTMYPQSGELSSYGVFLAENFSSLPSDNKRIFFVYSRDEVSQRWLDVRSRLHDRLLMSILSRKGYDAKRLGDLLQQDTEIYKHYATFDKGRGICTTPEPLSISRSYAILVPSSACGHVDAEKILPNLRSKVIQF